MKLLPCSTCIPDEKPQLIEYTSVIKGYRCPRCKKYSKADADRKVRTDNWNLLNDMSGLPAGCGELAKGLMKWA